MISAELDKYSIGNRRILRLRANVKSDSEIVSYAWFQTQGSTVVFNDGNAIAEPMVTKLIPEERFSFSCTIVNEANESLTENLTFIA